MTNMTLTVHHAELMTALQATLKRKVAALENDNWIFEAEQPSHDA